MKKILLSVFVMLLAVSAFSYNVGNPGKGRPHYTYNHVVVVGVDGMGAYNLNTDTPNIDRIFGKGAAAHRARAVDPTISAENWTSISTGVVPFYHKVGNHNIDMGPYPMSDTYPTIFRMVRRAFPDASIGSCVDWLSLNFGMVEDGFGVDKINYDWRNESAGTEQGEKYILEKKPKLFFMYFAGVDEIGHQFGWGSDEYYEQIRKTDGYIGRIYAAVEEAGMADDTLFVLVTDHGGINRSHGGLEDVEKYVFMGFRGKSVIPGARIESMFSRDLPAIVCYALNIEGNPLWDSRLPKGLFADYPNPPQRNIKKIASHKADPTPDAASEKGLYKYFDASKLRCAFFFDGTTEPQTGSITGEFTGIPVYGSGWYGKAVKLNWDNFFALPELKFGTDSFTVSMWMKPENDGVSQPPVFGNKDWESGYNPGFIVARYGTGVKFNLGAGPQKRDDFVYSMPYELTGRWTNVLLSVNRETGIVRTYINFNEAGWDGLKDVLQDASFDSGLPFTIGRDANGNDPSVMDYLADDLLVFDYAFGPEDVNKLKEYYNWK